MEYIYFQNNFCCNSICANCCNLRLLNVQTYQCRASGCCHMLSYIKVTRMKKQFVVTHAIRPTEIPALLDSWVTNTTSVKMLCPQKITSPYIFVKHNIFNCWAIKDVSSFVLSHIKCVLAPNAPGPPRCRGFMIKLRLNTLDRTPLEG